MAGWLRADRPGAAAAPGDQHSHVPCGAAFKTLLSSCDSLAPRVMAMETGARGPCGSCWGSGLGGACRLHYLLPGWVSRLPTFRAWAPCLPGDLGSLDGDTSQCRPLGGASGHFLLIMEASLTQGPLRGLAGRHYPGLVGSLRVSRADGVPVTWSGLPGGRGVLRGKGRGLQRPRSQVRCGVFTGSGSGG